MTYPPGKLPHHVLERLLREHTAHTDPRLQIGPGVGEDAAVIEFGTDAQGTAMCLVAKTDPITFATDEIGWYAVHVNANDIAAMGATPKWFLSTVIVPQAVATDRLFEEIFRQIRTACRQLGVTVAGGHSEITTGIDRPLVIGQMLGEVPAGEVIRSSGLLPHDAILLTKGLAIEATSILAREMGESLGAKGWTEDELAVAADFLSDPGISVVADARIAVEAGEVHAMHDPTEGGLATALMEIAAASGVDVDVLAEELPVSPVTQRLCADTDIDPLGAISSGALLIGCPTSSVNPILAALSREGVAAAQIGTVSGSSASSQPVLRLRRDGVWGELPCFAVDEVARLFGSAP